MSLKIHICAFAALVIASVAVPLANAGSLVEFYHKDLDHFFVTGNVVEINALDTGIHKGWSRTGLTIPTFDAANIPANSFAVCRFYGNPARGLDSHFYSASPEECATVKQKWPEDWLLESDEVFRMHAVNPVTGACPASTKPVYRLYNKRPDVNHRYTTELSVADSMFTKGYVFEGNGSLQRPIVFCAANLPSAPPPIGAPVCSVSASAAFPIINTPVTLTAACTGTPTSFGWINCISASSTCTVNASTVGTVEYGVVGTNASGSGAPASISLNWGVAGTAAPNCTVSASNAAPTLGTPLTLTANCSQAPSKFQWLACSALLIDACNFLSECASSTTSCAPIGTQSGSVYYALIASNSAGASPKAGVMVEWRTSGTGGPPPPPNSPTPYCTITASSLAPAVNTSLVLTASCTNSPTSYQWTNCASSSATCTTTESSPVTRTYRITAGNASGIGVPTEIAISWQQPPTGPPVCTLTPSTTTPYIGGSLTLTASCTQSPTSYNWTGCSSTTSTCQLSSGTLGPASYSVTASNSFGPGAPAQTSVTWGNPPPTGADFCGGYQQVVWVNLTWGGHIDTKDQGGFPADAVLVGRLTVPANATGTTVQGVASVVEFIDGQAQRMLSISPSSCDFRGFSPGVFPPTDSTGTNNPLGWSFGINPNVFYSLTTMPGGGIKLEPGRTYYINMRNRDFSGQSSCTTSTCNVRITVNAPQ